MPEEAPAAAENAPIVSVPVAADDVVRQAFVWNLAVEAARLGARTRVLAPLADSTGNPWPEPRDRPLGARFVATPAESLIELDDAASELEHEGGDDPELTWVCVPPTWIAEQNTRNFKLLLRWLLVFSTPERRDLMNNYALIKRACANGSPSAVGVTFHGARSRAAAERAFCKLADVSHRHLDLELVSYGLLADELQIYRSIVSRRPVGLSNPQSVAARALQDVARLFLGDAKEMAAVV